MGDAAPSTDPPVAVAATTDRLPAPPPQPLLPYERRPVGRVLIDDDAEGGVTVRVFSETATSWGLMACLGFAGIGALGMSVFAARDDEWVGAAALGAVGVAAWLALAWALFGKPAEPITFRATPDGLEYGHVAYGQAFIPRDDVAELLVTPDGRSGTSALTLRAPGGAEGILGGGPHDEVVAIADAMRRGLGIEAAARPATSDDGGDPARQADPPRTDPSTRARP